MKATVPLRIFTTYMIASCQNKLDIRLRIRGISKPWYRI